MKAIITVVGKDKTGIVAGVSTKIAELGLNIDDISQTVLEEYFTMMALVSSDEKQDFTALRNEFEAFGQELNVKINIQSAAQKISCKKDWDEIVSVLIYHVQKLWMQELLIFLRLFLRKTEAS